MMANPQLTMIRLKSIDILRALAIIFMVQVHFVGNLAFRVPSQALLYKLSLLLGGLAAPFFTFLVGVSLWVSLSRRRTGGQPEHQTAARTMRRALAIFGMGLVFNLIIWGPNEIFDWDILTFIGTALVIVWLAGFLPSWAIIGLSVVVLAVSPPLRTLVHFGAHWHSEYGSYTEYIVSWHLGDILLGWVLRGYFPILPWLVFPMAGFAMARHLLNAPDRARNRRAWNLLLGGLMLVLGGLVSHTVGLRLESPLGWYLSPMTFYPASTSFLLLTLGICLVSFVGLWLALDSDEALWAGSVRQAWQIVFERYSRYALSVYVVHHAVHLWPMYVAGRIQGDVWHYWQDWVTPARALVLATVFLAAFYIVLVGWDRVKGRGSLEWLLARALS
jgi:uncharacterized membrane protein